MAAALAHVLETMEHAPPPAALRPAFALAAEMTGDMYSTMTMTTTSGRSSAAPPVGERPPIRA